MVLSIFDRYLLKNIGIATLFVAIALAAIIMLTQSLRFLELIINSGASGLSFFALTFLAFPRFFEVILPIALMLGTVFIYNKMISDSEIVVMRTSGLSPLRLARPALIISVAVGVFVFFINAWIAPISLSKMQNLRTTIKTQYSNLLLREGVFNPIGKDLTVYIQKRGKEGELEGLLIHDTRDINKEDVTILAKRGVIVTDKDKQQVVIYDGSRQNYNLEKKILNSLDFKRYTLDLPESEPARQRWKEPDERTLYELINPDSQSRSDAKKWREFKTEIHRRFVSPILAITYTVLSLCCLLLGDINRRGLGLRISMAAGGVVFLQGLYLLSYNLAKDNLFGLFLMYGITIIPMVFGFYLLSSKSERFKFGLKTRLREVGVL